MFQIAEDLYGAAYVASQKAFQRVNIPPHLRHRFMADAKQEAAEALIRCNGKSKNYAFAAARRQVAMWVFEFLREDKSHRNDGNYIRVEHVALEPENELGEALNPRWMLDVTAGNDPESIIIRQEEAAEFEDLLDEIADIILDIMKSSRKQQVGRAAKAAVRDTNIILLALQGYNAEGIANELGDTPSNIRIYWRACRQRIEEYLSVSISTMEADHHVKV